MPAPAIFSGLVRGSGLSAQGARFIAAGLCNTLFGYTVFALVVLAGAASETALLVATLLGVAFNFQTSRRLVFQSGGDRALAFCLVYLALLLANLAALRALQKLGVSALAAQAALTLPFAALAFAAQRTFVFGPVAARLTAWFRHPATVRAPDGLALRLAAGILAASSIAFLLSMLAEPVMAATACGLVLASLWMVQRADAAPATAATGWLWAVAVAIALGLCLLGGEGRLLYANTDWQIRDAVLYDLTTQPWPVLYQRGAAGDWVLRAPIGMYLLPALAGKLLGWRAAQPALLLQNAALLAAILVVFMSTVKRWSGRLTVAAVFIAFSGWDLVGQIVFGKFAQPAAWQGLFPTLEVWARGLQYSSLMTDLFWAANHALPAWAMVAAYSAWRAGRTSALAVAAVAGLSMLWSPLAVMGAAPFVILANLSDWRSGRMSLVAPAVLAPLAIGLLPVALYLTLSSGQVEHHGNVFTSAFVVFYGPFALLEVAPLLYLGWRAAKGEAGGVQIDFLLCAALLLLIPMYKIGGSNDFMMRGSIFPITLLALMTGRGLAADLEARRFKAMIAPLVVLAIGAATPAAEMVRAVITPHNPPNPSDLFAAWENPASRGSSKATYITRLPDFSGMGWLLRQPQPKGAPRAE